MTSKFDPLLGDLQEMGHTHSRAWYWRQLAGAAVLIVRRNRRIQVALVAAALIATGASAGWWETPRLAVPIVLGFAITSWKLWRLHRTSLALLYATSVALLLPHWMMVTPISGADQVFWMIARLLAGYGVVGVLLVPFLILRLGRSGPLAEGPISMSITR